MGFSWFERVLRYDDLNATCIFSYDFQLTRDRIRQCQIFLNDPDLGSDATLRESLETIRTNAEEDFGSFLHLLTVYKADLAPQTALPVNPADLLSATDAPSGRLIRTKRDLADNEEDDDKPIEMK